MRRLRVISDDNSSRSTPGRLALCYDTNGNLVQWLRYLRLERLRPQAGNGERGDSVNGRRWMLEAAVLGDFDAFEIVNDEYIAGRK